MPRPPEVTPLRRFLEQAIMWIVLAATVGMAALVSFEVNQLGPPRSLDGVTLRLPENWREIDADDDDVLIALQERGEPVFARRLVVRRSRKSLLDSLFPQQEQEHVKLPGGGTATIEIGRRAGVLPRYRQAVPMIDVKAVLTPPPGTRGLEITIRQVDHDSERDVELNLELMRKILGTVRFGTET